MKHLAIAALAILTPALGFAADLPSRAAPTAPLPTLVQAEEFFTWSGLYVGATAGLANAHLTFGSSPLTHKGGTLGLTVGYNFQADNNALLGIELDQSLTNIDLSRDTTSAKISSFGTARLRAGFALGSVLPYLTGGFAWQSQKLSIASVSADDRKTGWTVGGGVEVALTGQVSAKLEYLHVQMTQDKVLGADLRGRNNIARMGLNYRF